jgi:hypothetical protein
MKYFLLILTMLALPVVAKDKSECGNMPDLEVIAKQPFVMLGEIHGTEEVPKLFGDLVCQSLNNHSERVAVFLEMPKVLQPLLNKYLRSEIDVKTLLAHPVWSPQWQDGRYSVAMLGLINRLKRLTQTQPNRMDVWLIDFIAQNKNGRDKSQYLAENVTSAPLKQYKQLLALVGNLHNRINLDKGTSAAMLLSELDPFSLTITAQKGSYWACQGPTAADCKPYHFNRSKPIGPVGVKIYQDKQYWHGVYRFETLTASKPAVLSGG